MAVPDAQLTSGEAPLAVELDGSASTDPDDRILAWHWEFGDGQRHALGDHPGAALSRMFHQDPG